LLVPQVPFLVGKNQVRQIMQLVGLSLS